MTQTDKPCPKWHNDLIRCPSQCYLDVDMETTLYMRWRGGDPWSFSVIHDLYGESEQWYDIDDYPRFTHDEYLDAQVWFERWWKQNQDTVYNYFYIKQHGESKTDGKKAKGDD